MIGFGGVDVLLCYIHVLQNKLGKLGMSSNMICCFMGTCTNVSIAQNYAVQCGIMTIIVMNMLKSGDPV